MRNVDAGAFGVQSVVILEPRIWGNCICFPIFSREQGCTDAEWANREQQPIIMFSGDHDENIFTGELADGDHAGEFTNSD